MKTLIDKLKGKCNRFKGRLSRVFLIVVLLILIVFFAVLLFRVSFQPVVIFFLRVFKLEAMNQDVVVFMKQHMDLLASVTWTQMAILGAFVVYFLGTAREYRYGISIRKITSQFYGSLFIPILTIFAVFSVVAMTVSYYVKDYVRFYDFAIMAIALQFGVMLAISVLLSDSLIKKIIHNMEKERFIKLLRNAEMDSSYGVIKKNRPIVSAVFKGNDLLEDRMTMIMELEQIDVQELTNMKNYDKTRAFLYFRQSFDVLNRMLFLENELICTDSFRYYASIIVTNYNKNAGYLGNWYWLSAIWISLVECASERNWKAIQQILQMIEGEDEIVFQDCLRIVLTGTCFLWHCQKIDEKKTIEGIEQILRFQNESGNQNLVRKACELSRREETLLEEKMSIWKNAYGDWEIDPEVWYQLVTVLRAESFFDSAFILKLNEMIRAYTM